MKKAYLHIYTGDGKGKTTAAVGLCARALGAGLKIYFAQFMKGKESGEFAVLKKWDDNFDFETFSDDCFIWNKASIEQCKLAQRGLVKVEKILKSAEYDLVIMDEANNCIEKGLFTVDQLLDTIKYKAEETELVITGRSADRKLIEAADLVTEMKKVKHYFDKGVRARKGIES